MLSVSSEVQRSVGGEVFQVEVEDGLGILDTHDGFKIILLYFKGPFSVIVFVQLDIAVVFRVQVLVCLLESHVSFSCNLFVFPLEGFGLFIVLSQNRPKVVIFGLH